MLIHDIGNYLVNLTKQDVKPDIYSVFDLPGENYVKNRCPENIESEKLTILEILNAIGCRLKNLFGFVKINTTTETIDETKAAVNVSGDVDNLNFDFKIPRGKDGPPGPKGEPGPANLLIITATASSTAQGEYTPNVAYNEALTNIQANKAVMIKIENAAGRYYIPYSASTTQILASAGTISGSNQSIELYTLKWTATTNIITLTGTKKGCTADGGTKGQVLTKKSNESFDTEWIDPGTGFLINANAGAHNSIYRGKYLGTNITATQYAAIAAGTFEDLYIGDFWTIDGINYRIAAFNYFLNSGDIVCTTNHVVIVPDTPLYNASMNDTNTTSGGYAGSIMYTANLEQAKTTIKNAFNGHILNHRIILSNSVENGVPSSTAWYDSDISLMCEQMVYGSGIFSPVSNGVNIPKNYYVEKTQLPLFRHEPSRIANKSSWWLRNVISSTNYADVYLNGSSDNSRASNSYGVRPYFSIY